MMLRSACQRTARGPTAAAQGRVMLAPAAALLARRTGSPRRLVAVPAISADRYAELWQAHIDTEFTEKSADSAVATMVDHATVNHVPVMTGGVGKEALRSFYANHFIPKMPEDVEITPLQRTVATEAGRVIDEFLFSFTHNVTMDWMLPGIAPTGRRVSVPFVVVVDFEGEKLKAERIYWDQATVLKQIGLLPEGLPVPGAEQATKTADLTAIPSNGLMKKHCS